MEKQKNSIDDFFREALKNHKIVPSEQAKAAFMKEASEIPQRKWYRKGLFLYFLLAILIITGSLIIYYFPGNSTNDEPVVNTNVSRNFQTEQKTILSDADKSSKINTDIHINKTNHSKINQTVINPNPVQVNNKSTKNIELYSEVTQTIPVNNAVNKAISRNQDETSGENIIPFLTHDPGLLSESLTIIETPDTSVTIPYASSNANESQPLSYDIKTGKKPRLNKDWYFSAAIQYTPEWMFNTLEEGKYVNNFGIEGIFTIGNYSIRTGLGLSITKGTNELVVEYNDFLGSYNKLDSMSFTWDGSINDYIPSYYMSSQDVWDSLMKLDYLKVVKRYTYLQIPLILGYDFWHSERFSIGLRAGPLLSVLVSSKQLSEDYDPGKKKVIKINNITPEQVSLNWQFMGGINASVRLSKNLLFEIEPMAKYYFNSVYEKSEINDKPWSIGVRAALIIKL